MINILSLFIVSGRSSHHLLNVVNFFMDVVWNILTVQCKSVESHLVIRFGSIVGYLSKTILHFHQNYSYVTSNKPDIILKFLIMTHNLSQLLQQVIDAPDPNIENSKDTLDNKRVGAGAINSLVTIPNKPYVHSTNEDSAIKVEIAGLFTRVVEPQQNTRRAFVKITNKAPATTEMAAPLLMASHNYVSNSVDDIFNMAQEIAFVKKRVDSVINSSFKAIDAQIEELELDPILSLSCLPQEVNIIWLLAKLGQTDFFGLKMLLKRTKQTKIQHQPIMNYLKEIVAAQSQAKYDKLLKLVNGPEGKTLFKDYSNLFEKIPPIIEKFVIEQIASFYTCIKLPQLATLLGQSTEHAAQLVHLSGYHEQDGWVKFPQQSSSAQNIKQLIKTKQYELTQLSTLLSSKIK